MNITNEQREIMNECLAGGDEVNAIYTHMGYLNNDICCDLAWEGYMDMLSRVGDIFKFALTHKGISELQRLQADEEKERESVLAASGMKGSAAGAKLRENVHPGLGRMTDDWIEAMGDILSLAGIDVPVKNKPEHSEQERIIDGLATVARKLFDEKESASENYLGMLDRKDLWYGRACGLKKENAELKAEIKDLNHDNKRLRGVVRYCKDKWANWNKEGLPEEEIEKLKAQIPVKPDREKSEFILTIGGKAFPLEKLDFFAKYNHDKDYMGFIQKYTAWPSPECCVPKDEKE